MLANKKIMLLHAGLAIIWPSELYDEHSENLSEPPILSIVNEGMNISIGQMDIHCSLEMLGHLIDYGPELFFYEDEGKEVLCYYGKLDLVRDRLLEIKGALLYQPQ